MTGVRRWAGNDLIELQQQPLQAIDAFFAQYGNCILKGCEVQTASDNTYDITPGFVALAGTDQDDNETFKVVPFAGIEGVTLPIYLTLIHSVIERPYTDGKVKPVAYDFRAAASSILPENVPYLEISVTGGRQFVDAIRLTEKLDQTGNGRDVMVTFAQAAKRENISSGEKLSALWGKVCRWFADLKAVAFSGKAADLEEDQTHRFFSDTERDKLDGIAENANRYVHPASHPAGMIDQDAAHRFVSDTEKSNWNDKYTKAETDAKLKDKANSTHSHTIENITSLQVELDKKYPKTGFGNLTFNSTGIPIIKNSSSYAGFTAAGTPVDILSIKENNDVYAGYRNSILHLLGTSVKNAAGNDFFHSGNLIPYALQNRGTKIPDGSDLNDYKEFGSYFVEASQFAATIKNTPWTTNGYRLIVQAGYGEKMWLYQIAYGSSEIAYRIANTALVFSEWRYVPDRDTLYMRLSEKADKTHTHPYEPVFSKNTAFNKNFGTTAGTVAQGNHTHSGVVRFVAQYQIDGSSTGAQPYKMSGDNVLLDTVRLSAGKYGIRHNMNTLDYIVILDGNLTTVNKPAKVSLMEQSNISITVVCSDNETPKDSSFYITILRY